MCMAAVCNHSDDNGLNVNANMEIIIYNKHKLMDREKRSLQSQESDVILTPMR